MLSLYGEIFQSDKP